MSIPVMPVVTLPGGERVGNFNCLCDFEFEDGQRLVGDVTRHDSLYVDGGYPSALLESELRRVDDEADYCFVDECVFLWVQANWRGDKTAFVSSASIRGYGLKKVSGRLVPS
jgi:hypothetical protein